MELHQRGVEQDVRELSTLLGDIIELQASTAALASVEEVRECAIAYRREAHETRRELREALDGADSTIISRAFTSYFELINLAEERERVRTIRERAQDGPAPESIREAVEQLSDESHLQQILDETLVQPTFTAHPTEARRKTIKAKLRSVAEILEQLDECRLTDRERARLERELDAEVTSLWQTPHIRDRRPEVIDEALNVQWYLENVLFDVVGEVYDELETALAETGGEFTVPKLIEFRSWAGSDRDGNPYVTPSVTAETLERQRDVVLSQYWDELKRLSGVLSQDTREIELTEAFEERLSADKTRFPTLANEVELRYPNEHYRQKLKLMRERVSRVGDVRPGGYEHADELHADLEAVADSLCAGNTRTVADSQVAPMIRQVETFGFSLASLDLRDHRENHTKTVAAVFDRHDIDYRGMDERERTALLTRSILQDGGVVDTSTYASFEETPRRVLHRFDALADWQAEYGIDAIDTYCISMTEEPSHVLEVVFLADQAGVVSLPEHAGLDVVPLLETESALSGARRIMGTLFENEAYGAVLAARDDVQEVMLGYSDSNKENGFLAANWSLYENQKRLAAITAEYDISLRLFHGRGGSLSRGGGSTNEALLALPPETVTGAVKYTEQGEAIAEKYANSHLAERNIEQALNAQLRARRRALTGDLSDLDDDWFAVMEVAADAAREAYRSLLEREHFVSYFEDATPIRVIEELNLGSRPASRSGERSVEDLRAIPWVFSWTQCRCILPGWYGLGIGLEASLEEESLETLQEMYEEWPFFRTMLDHAALSLARTDLEIAAEYATLSEHRDEFFPQIRAEYDRCVDLVRRITGRDRLPRREWLVENLERRNPYVDPLNLLQVRLLEQDDRSTTEEQTLRLTVKGIAAGMKSTG